MPAASATAPADTAGWLSRNTDLLASQIAIVGPDNVYSLEPLGPRLPAGEMTALVRTEPLADGWGKAHGFQSWEASLLIDCSGKRMRALRSARYPGRNRQGQPSPEPADADWMAPRAGEPAAQLLAAACDPAFPWPLRVTAKLPPPAQPSSSKAALLAPSAPVVLEAKTVEAEAPPRLAAATAVPPPMPAITKATVSLPAPLILPAKPAPATAPPQPAAAAPPTPYFLQVSRGPSEAGARKALKAAHATLGAATDGLSDSVEKARQGRRIRYTARIEGFASAAAAETACDTLAIAGQGCFVRPATRTLPQ